MDYHRYGRGLTTPIGIVLSDATAALAGEMVSVEEIFKQVSVKQPSIKTSQQARSSLGSLT